MGLLFQPRILTQNAISILSRNAKAIKVFTDGSASIPAKRGGLGLVAKFNFLTLEIAEPINSPASSYLSEWLAVEHALDIFKDHKLFINCDNQTVVNMLSKEHTPAKLPKIVQRVKEKFQKCGAEIKFIAKPSRVGAHNRADKLAKKARTEGKSFFRVISL